MRSRRIEIGGVSDYWTGIKRARARMRALFFTGGCGSAVLTTYSFRRRSFASDTTPTEGCE